MSEDGDTARQVEQLLDTPILPMRWKSERFKQFLDHVPVAIAGPELHPNEVHHLCEPRLRAADRPIGWMAEGETLECAPGQRDRRGRTRAERGGDR